MGQSLTIGERVRWYRRRRGMPQPVLAGLVGRTEDWLSKVENNRINLDRLSVIRSLAEALDVSIGDLVGEPTLIEWTPASGTRTVSALREALLDYRQLSEFSTSQRTDKPPQLIEVHQAVKAVWEGYQESRYGYVTNRLPTLLEKVQAASRAYDGDAGRQAAGLLALAHQAATVLLTKLGEADLAWISAERGFQAARRSENPVVVGSLFRSLIHALQSIGRYRDAIRLTEDAATYLKPGLRNAAPRFLSIHGALFLAGAMAAARCDDRAAVQGFLAKADAAATRLGRDANHLWTAFGPTNVAMHKVSTALELGDLQTAITLGPRIDSSSLPVERQARHAIEIARAYDAWNRVEDAQAALRRAELVAPEQVQYHSLSRELVRLWIRRGHAKPDPWLAGLAQRMRILN